MPALAAVLGCLATAAACVGAGAMVLRFGPSGLSRGEWLALSFLTGAPVLSLAVFLLSAAGAAYAGVFVAIGLAIVVSAAIAARPEFDAPKPEPLPWWAIAPLAAFGVWYFVHALAPEASPDGSGYHLGLVRRYFEAHRLYPVPTNMYASLSQGLEMLFLFAYAIGRHSAAALVHLVFLGALATLVFAFGRRAGHAAAGAAAAVVLAASPVVGIDAATAYNDVAMAACLFAAFFLLWGRVTLTIRGSETGVVTIAGLLAGFAMAIKYTAAIPALFALFWVVSRALRTRTRHAAIGFAVACGVMSAPWLIRNQLWLDNPAAPFFNRWFPNPHMHVSVEEDYRAAMRSYNGAALNAGWPLEVTLQGARLQGVVGPAFLLAPIALLSLRRAEGRALLGAAAATLLAYPANLGVRFLIPALPFLALAIAVSLPKSAAPALALAAAIACWPAVVDRYAETAWRIREFPWRAALRMEPEEQFLAARLDPTYSIARMIDSHVPTDGTVYTALPLPEAYGSRRILLDYTGALNTTLSETLAGALPGVSGRAADTLTDRTRRHWQWTLTGLEAQSIRIRPPRNASGGWRLYDVRVEADAQINSVTAEPNAWQAGLAFDNNPATFWSPWRADQRDSAWVANFASLSVVRNIRIAMAGPDGPPRLEAGYGDRWNLVAVAPDRVDTEFEYLRPHVTRYFQSSGVTHVLLHEAEPAYRAVSGREQEWGWTRVARSGPGFLYQIRPQGVDLRAESRNNRR